MTQPSPAQAQTSAKPSLNSDRSGVLQRQCKSCGQHTIAGECAECKKKQPLQRQAVNSGAIEEVPPIVHEVLRSPGQPLDAETRAFMESRFSHDFSQVRVHTDAKAAESARAVDALAYTVGSHLVLDNPLLPARSYARQKVLAHELTHVIQQSHMAPSNEVTMCNDALLEAQANDSAQQMMHGHAVRSGSSQADRLMRIPRSLQRSVNPQMMMPDEIAHEIDEINRYLEISVLSQETIDHLNQMREHLITEQQRRLGSGNSSQPVSAASAPARREPPFFGLQPADTAFHGIQMYYIVASLPHTDRTEHTFRRGPYLIALNEVLLPDESRRIGFYIAYRRADTLLFGGQGWNEFVIGPDSIEQFLDNLSMYVGVAAPVYMFGPPAPYQAASGRAVQRAMEGDVGAATSALGDAWVEAVQDPSWWVQAVGSTAGALGRTSAARPPVGGLPGSGPSISRSSIAGGRGGSIPMRVGPGGRRIVASTPRALAAEAPIARTGAAIEGNTARSLAPAPALDPVAAPRPTLTLVPESALGVGLPAPRPLLPPAVGAIGTVGASVVKPHATDQTPPIAPTQSIERGEAPHQRRGEHQTCRNDVLDPLQAEKDRICNSIPSRPDWSPSRSEKMLNRIKCSEIRPRLQAFEECLRIRRVIQETCFRDAPVDVHLEDVIPQLERSLENGRRRLAINCAPGHPMANQ